MGYILESGQGHHRVTVMFNHPQDWTVVNITVSIGPAYLEPVAMYAVDSAHSVRVAVQRLRMDYADAFAVHRSNPAIILLNRVMLALHRRYVGSVESFTVDPTAVSPPSVVKPFRRAG